MALLDREYMRPDYKKRKSPKPRLGLWVKIRFFAWRMVQVLKRRLR